MFLMENYYICVIINDNYKIDHNLKILRPHKYDKFKKQNSCRNCI